MYWYNLPGTIEGLEGPGYSTEEGEDFTSVKNIIVKRQQDFL